MHMTLLQMSPTPAARGSSDLRRRSALPRKLTSRRLSQLRAGMGVAHLLFPGLAAQLLVRRPLGDRARRVIRVLGARQLAQALATGEEPTVAVLLLGAEVDIAHATSMVALALSSRRWRRAGLADALVATGLASVGAAAAARAGSRLTTRVGLRALPDRCAERLARRLVPDRLKPAPAPARLEEATTTEERSACLRSKS